jgi:hypothetical protein
MNSEILWLVLAIFFVLSLLFLRELACWYWKINASLDVLREIRDLLVAQQKQQQTELFNSAPSIKQRVEINEISNQLTKTEKPVEPKTISIDDLNNQNNAGKFKNSTVPFELQKGCCPNCDYIQAMTSIYCTKCGPRFGNSERCKLERIM